jgi:hypothetical protein
MADLAAVYSLQGRFSEAEKLAESAWKIEREASSFDHQDTVPYCATVLLAIHGDSGQTTKAEVLRGELRRLDKKPSIESTTATDTSPNELSDSPTSGEHRANRSKTSDVNSERSSSSLQPECKGLRSLVSRIRRSPGIQIPDSNELSKKIGSST